MPSGPLPVCTVAPVADPGALVLPAAADAAVLTPALLDAAGGLELLLHAATVSAAAAIEQASRGPVAGDLTRRVRTMIISLAIPA